MSLPSPKKATIAVGECIYAVGDIHGRVDLLSKLVKKIAEDAATVTEKKKLIFLGDYVDRGEHSKEVIDFLLHKLPPDMEPVFLRGNHEDVMLRFLKGDYAIGADWLRFGGMATLASYGVNPYVPGILENIRMVRNSLASQMPLAHKKFIATTEIFYVSGDFCFVHAGVRPGVKLEKQKPEDLMWSRTLFIGSMNDHGKIIVHGHTIVSRPEIRHNRIAIDTGAYATGRLTCLKLSDTEQKFLTT